MRAALTQLDVACALPPSFPFAASAERCARFGTSATTSRVVSHAVATEVGRGAAGSLAHNCSAPSDGDVWLSAYPRGALYMFYEGRWGTVCVHGFDRYQTFQAVYPAAGVVCRQLGYPTRSAVFVGARRTALVSGGGADGGARRRLGGVAAEAEGTGEARMGGQWRQPEARRRLRFFDPADADAALAGSSGTASADAAGSSGSTQDYGNSNRHVPMNNMWAHCRGSEPTLAHCGTDRWVYAGNQAAAEAPKCETHADDVILECAGEQAGDDAEARADEDGSGELREGSTEHLRLCGSRLRKQNRKRPMYDNSENWLGVDSGESPDWVSVDIGSESGQQLRAEGQPTAAVQGAGALTAGGGAVLAAAMAALAAAAAVAARRRARGATLRGSAWEWRGEVRHAQAAEGLELL